MENKETISMYIAEAVAINQVFGETKFGDLSIDSISSLLEFKFELSKIVKERDEYIKNVVEEVKTDEFKELSDKEDKTEEEKEQFESITKEINNKANEIISKYHNQIVEINVSKLNRNDFYTFCKTNNFTMTIIEFLYNKLVK